MKITILKGINVKPILIDDSILREVKNIERVNAGGPVDVGTPYGHAKFTIDEYNKAVYNYILEVVKVKKASNIQSSSIILDDIILELAPNPLLNLATPDERVEYIQTKMKELKKYSLTKQLVEYWEEFYRAPRLQIYLLTEFATKDELKHMQIPKLASKMADVFIGRPTHTFTIHGQLHFLDSILNYLANNVEIHAHPDVYTKYRDLINNIHEHFQDLEVDISIFDESTQEDIKKYITPEV